MRALGNAPTLADGVARFGLAAFGSLSLSARERELLVLQAAAVCRCHYEIRQHRVLAAQVGVTALEMEALGGLAPEPGMFSERERQLLRLGREVAVEATCSATTFADVRLYWSPRAVTEAILLVGYYRMMAGLANSLDIEIDGDLAGGFLPFFSEGSSSGHEEVVRRPLRPTRSSFGII